MQQREHKRLYSYNLNIKNPKIISANLSHNPSQFNHTQLIIFAPMEIHDMRSFRSCWNPINSCIDILIIEKSHVQTNTPAQTYTHPHTCTLSQHACGNTQLRGHKILIYAYSLFVTKSDIQNPQLYKYSTKKRKTTIQILCRESPILTAVKNPQILAYATKVRACFFIRISDEKLGC